MADIFEKERDLILQEYSADYDNETPTYIKVYLSITPEIHYTIELDYKNYPEVPIISLPPTLHDEIGDPVRFLPGVSRWTPQNPPHIIDLLHELEEILRQITYPNEEMEDVMTEFTAFMSGAYKLHVILHSYKLRNFEFDIIHKKPNPPSLSFSPALQKILNPKEIKNLSKWPRTSLIDVCREISTKIDHRTRILEELRQLDARANYQKYIRRAQDQSLLIDLRIEIETSEFIEFQIRLSEEFPLNPPDFTLKQLSDEALRDDLNQLFISLYNEWQHATTLVELLDDITAYLKRKSKQICQICHSYKCPKCGKPIKTKITGISGETECSRRCSTCSANFHRCCWIEQLRLTRKCPVCLTPKESIY